MWRKFAPVPLCPPQIPHDFTRARGPPRWETGDRVPELGHDKFFTLLQFNRQHITIKR
jgi:hypothetical protein